MASNEIYPVRVAAQLDDDLSRWKWLVKWFLAIPHFFILVFLWLGFFFASVIAFFAILFTGRYPRGIFDYNVGVMRWSWRVAYYSYGTLGTDRYPPFTLEEVADYPTHLTVDYPEKLSRGLVLIKWWLLALPHYIVVAILAGGGTWFAFQGDDWGVVGSGLIGFLTFVAGVILLFSGKYPVALFDLLLGFNRWVLRVVGYASLMTDDYPPFRLDTGPTEPGDTGIAISSTDPGSTGAAAVVPARSGWSTGRVMAVIFGSLVGLVGFGITTAGGVALWADSTQREDGFVTSPTERFETDGYAIVSENIEFHAEGADWATDALIGDARLRVAAADGEDIFVGVGDTEDVRGYLSGVSYSVVSDLTDGDEVRDVAGDAPDGNPGDQEFWIASSEGPGTQGIEFPLSEGDWSIVVMDPEPSPGLNISGDVGAEVPSLKAIAIGLLVAGLVLLLIGIALIIGAIRRAGREVQTQPPATTTT